MIGIIGAMDLEVDGIISAMTVKEEKVISSVKFIVGTLCGKDIVLAKCGIGKVNAAVCTQTMILKFAPDFIINSGIAGGVGDNVKIGDLVIGTSCVQHDYDTTAIGDKLGTVFTNKGNLINLPCDEKYSNMFVDFAKGIYDGETHRGVIATGDQFVADGKKCLFFKEEFDAVACEMEGGSICQVCFLNDVPFVVLRSISDNANHEETVDYMEFAATAAQKLIKLLNKALALI